MASTCRPPGGPRGSFARAPECSPRSSRPPRRAARCERSQCRSRQPRRLRVFQRQQADRGSSRSCLSLSDTDDVVPPREHSKLGARSGVPLALIRKSERTTTTARRRTRSRQFAVRARDLFAPAGSKETRSRTSRDVCARHAPRHELLHGVVKSRSRRGDRCEAPRVQHPAISTAARASSLAAPSRPMRSCPREDDVSCRSSRYFFTNVRPVRADASVDRRTSSPGSYSRSSSKSMPDHGSEIALLPGRRRWPAP